MEWGMERRKEVGKKKRKGGRERKKPEQSVPPPVLTYLYRHISMGINKNIHVIGDAPNINLELSLLVLKIYST